jgi:16S rRNA (cytosine1402-N4)-methyltransferase|tara:strand:+ start:2099 stop:3100 length:1002 start_codon:yes stop_codon:yes gene_type:complete
MSATINLEKKHFPVLLDEIIKIISPQYSGTFLDCTFGQGGYSEKILENSKNKVIAFDRDSNAIKLSERFKKHFKDRFEFNHKKFSEIKNINSKNIKAIIFDLGYSTDQIFDEEKGLSFNSKGTLNMKIGLNQFSAHEAINKLDKEDLTKIFKFFGDEKDAKKISQAIFRKRNNHILKTEDLVEIINKEKKNYNFKINKSTKIFQSLRIFVNQEISELIFGLINAYKLLPVNGYIVVVTFHSLEDRIVKFFFKNYSEDKKVSRYLPSSKNENKIFEVLNKKVIIPSTEEIKKNPPSRSAKLRYARKIKEGANFEEFLLKFKNLIEIENIGKKLC